MQRRTVAAATLGLVVVTSCTSAPADTTDPSDWGCESPPESELVANSPFPLRVTPTSAHPGGTVSLHVGEVPGVEADHGVSPQLRWQCWNGTDWIDTHQLTRNGPTAEIAPGETVTSIATLLFVPDDFLITIPEVAPGRYRIKETGFGKDGPTGYVVFEVLGAEE